MKYRRPRSNTVNNSYTVGFVDNRVLLAADEPGDVQVTERRRNVQQSVFVL